VPLLNKLAHLARDEADLRLVELCISASFGSVQVSRIS